MRFTTTAKIQELNGVRCNNDEDEKPALQPMLNHVMLSFDLNKIPEGDVASGAWLDSLYDAFMRQEFSTLPDGVRLWELVQAQAKPYTEPDFLNPLVYCTKCRCVHNRHECKANTDSHT